MLFKNLHAKLEEEKAKASSIDGRRFNVRSKIKMEREAASLRRNSDREDRKKEARRRNNRGVFSEEEIREGEEAKRLFREEMSKKRVRETCARTNEAKFTAEPPPTKEVTSIIEEKESIQSTMEIPHDIK